MQTHRPADPRPYRPTGPGLREAEAALAVLLLLRRLRAPVLAGAAEWARNTIYICSCVHISTHVINRWQMHVSHVTVRCGMITTTLYIYIYIYIYVLYICIYVCVYIYTYIHT